jgi:tRNA (cytidine/uridine-2'-O-)-methyltransferase|tara:strand:+ start:989 stop:1471 length:483 start_codon:yes stop_codon:yes gene_type:complete
MVTMTHKNKVIGPKIALYEPDIPQNTASIIRTCSCLGANLEIIEPCGFLFTDKRFKRVVMDYMEVDRIRFYKSADEFFNFKKNKRIILISTKGIKSYTNFNFNASDTILFGRESAGVPKKVHNKVNEILKIPMIKNKRSLNLASSVAIVLAEQLRQIRNY